MSSNRALISMKTYLGDAVMTLPLIDTMESRYQVEVLTSATVAQIVGLPCGGRKIVPFSKERKLRQIVAQARDLRKRGYDVAVLVNHSFRSALIARLAGIRVRIGHAHDGRSPLLTHPVHYDEQVFEAHSMCDLVEPLGLPVCRVAPRLVVSEEERALGDRLREGAVIAIQPGARFSEKQIPIRTTIEVARLLQAEGHRVALIGGKEEAKFAEEVTDGLSEPVVNLVGKTSIRETLGCLSGFRATLGADTGLMHLSAASGTPTVQIFGPTPASKWGHAYLPNCVLQAPEGDMERLEPQAIYEAVLQVLRIP